MAYYLPIVIFGIDKERSRPPICAKSHFLNPNIDILMPSSLPPTLSSSDKEDDEGHPETGYIFIFKIILYGKYLFHCHCSPWKNYQNILKHFGFCQT